MRNNEEEEMEGATSGLRTGKEQDANQDAGQVETDGREERERERGGRSLR